MYVNPNLPILPTLFAPFLIFQPREIICLGVSSCEYVVQDFERIQHTKEITLITISQIIPNP